MFNNVQEKGAALYNNMAEKGAQYKKAVCDTSAQALERSGEVIKANPHRSVMSAFGLGALIGGAAIYLLMQDE